ncbi:MAG: alginate export family protein [Planctomycetes bacterium]|nr:alginate export family protein [Planctomycetota bacterium]
MNLRISAVTTATVLALAPFALAINNDDDSQQKRIKELERQVEELTRTVKGLQEQQTRTPSNDDLDRAIADLANRIETRVGLAPKGGQNVSAPDVRGIKLSFEDRMRAEFYSDRTFGARKNDPISPSPLNTSISPMAPSGTVLGSFLGTPPNFNAEQLDDASRLLNRVRMNIDVDVDDKLDAFFQLQHSQSMGTALGASAGVGGSLLPNAPNTALVSPVPPGAIGEPVSAAASAGAIAFKQAYVRFKQVYKDVDITLGRFNLDLGKGRILSSADWDNVGRAFDGMRVDWTNNDISVSAFATKVVQGGLDFQSQDTNFLGGWVKLNPAKDVHLTPYTLWVDNNTTTDMVMVGKPWTIGVLADVEVQGGLKFNGEAGLQQDHNRPNTPIQGAKNVDFGEAYYFAIGGEYELNIDGKEKYKPKVGIEYTEGSKLFNDLYGARHGLYGLGDFVTTMNNLRQWKVYAGITPTQDLDVVASYYFMRLTRDAGEGVLGVPHLSQNLGQEFDLEVHHKCSKNLNVSAGWSHFFNGNAFQDAAFDPGAAYATALSQAAYTRKDADTIFVSVEVKF